MFKNIKICEYKDNKKISNDVKSIDYLNPKNIYLPLFDHNESYECLVNLDQKVIKGEIVAVSTKTKIPLHSSVSGIVKSINTKMWTKIGKLVECIEIENDYQETINNILENRQLTKDEIIKSIQEAGIIGMGGAGFPTYIKYQKEADILIVNGCECEPFITCDYRLMLEQTIKLINGTHYALKALNASVAYIAIKKQNHEVIDILNKYIDDKIKLLLVNNKYPVGWERYLVYKATKRKYNNIPIEVGCIVNNVSTIIAINEAVRYRQPLIERLVTITGYCLENPINVRCKIGTTLDEIINYIGGLKHKYHKKVLMAGGGLTGKSIPVDELVITKSLNCVTIMPLPKEYNKLSNCIGCGRCAYICPTKLTPTEIKKYYQLKDKEELNNLKSNKCIECGLCSYICPSKIDLTFFTTKAKEFLKRG